MNLKGISGHAPIITVKTDRQGRFLSGAIHSLYQWPGVGAAYDSKHGAARQIKLLSEADVPKVKPLSTPRAVSDRNNPHLLHLALN